MIVDAQDINEFADTYGSLIKKDTSEIIKINLDKFSEKELKLVGINKPIGLSNGKLDSLELHYCENITVENCKIKFLSISHANNNTFNNNIILKSATGFCKTNTFMGNLITKSVYSDIQHRKWIFEHYQFGWLIGSILFGLFYYFLAEISLIKLILLIAVSYISILAIGYLLFFLFKLRKYNHNQLIENKIIPHKRSNQFFR